jgi:hypothetical protein
MYTHDYQDIRCIFHALREKPEKGAERKKKRLGFGFTAFKCEERTEYTEEALMNVVGLILFSVPSA